MPASTSGRGSGPTGGLDHGSEDATFVTVRALPMRGVGAAQAGATRGASCDPPGAGALRPRHFEITTSATEFDASERFEMVPPVIATVVSGVGAAPPVIR